MIQTEVQFSIPFEIYITTITSDCNLILYFSENYIGQLKRKLNFTIQGKFLLKYFF